MTRLLLAPLLLVGALLADVPAVPLTASLPDMPVRRLTRSEAERLDLLRLNLLTFNGVFVGFIFRPEGNVYAGAYLHDPATDSFTEVGAWRGELVGPCPTEAACADGIAALARLVQAMHAQRSLLSEIVHAVGAGGGVRGGDGSDRKSVV